MSFYRFEDENVSQLYARARPNYGTRVFETIFNYCKKGDNKFKLAVDVGCGTGNQSTLPLAARFEKVIGVDVSETQLAKAPRTHFNIEFRKSSAENLSFIQPDSVDLVTAAAALHWFNIPEFFAELERVLTPGGCFVVFTYGWPVLLLPEAQAVLEEFTNGIGVPLLEPYHVLGLNGYRDVTFPYPCSRSNIDVAVDWTVDQVCDYFSSLSTWQILKKRYPENDTLSKLKAEVMKYRCYCCKEAFEEFGTAVPKAMLSDCESALLRQAKPQRNPKRKDRDVIKTCVEPTGPFENRTI